MTVILNLALQDCKDQYIDPAMEHRPNHEPVLALYARVLHA